MASDYPYHKGELAVQERAGVAQAARASSGALRDSIPAGALYFIREQTMVVAGSLDAAGGVWASVLFGTPGFLRAVDERILILDRRACHTATGDPLWDNLQSNPGIGLLLIELETRRRLRINGRIRTVTDSRCVIDVERAYANCPKYIQRRRLQLDEPSDEGSKALYRQGRQLDAARQAWIERADTFFVASAHPEQGVDASHRGGYPGFVKVLNPHRLRVPDYAGNNMFNTLGNFAGYPHAGLVFIDFERGHLLQLSGVPELRWDLTDAAGETGGTARYWEFEVECWRETVLPVRPGWQFLDYSPFSPQPDNHASKAQPTLDLRVERAWHETARVKAFRLVAADGSELPPVEAGAHLPVRVRDGNGEWVERCYSLSSDPADRSHYRIGVLAETDGRGGSLYLHNSLRTGDRLQARRPENAFPLETRAGYSILLAGGIGITPLLSMMHALKAKGRPFELHYSARHTRDLAFRQEILALTGGKARFYASGEPDAARLRLQAILANPVPGAHLYVCGPRRMIVAVRDLSRANGWPAEQIHFESFGAGITPHDRELTITLARSGRVVRVPPSRTVLDVLLDEGLGVPHECQRGECSLCATRVIEGEPEHRDLCLNTEERKNSMCVCVSRARSGSLTLDL
jgi:ferredoxin-NADP reductase/predicted pyridoxine 5'-phosphate oxidase superfamily flavin-nucleotide-binding protein